MQLRPNILSIAGFDPCGGAGVLADIKAFETCGAYGMGVVSSLTFQNDDTFDGLRWIDFEEIKQQLNLLVKNYNFDYYKIGIIESLDILADIILYLKETQPNAKCIWDTVLKASAGFIFHNNIDRNKLDFVLKNCYLITPNIEEAKVLFNSIEVEYLQKLITENNYCNILLKGGHSDGLEKNDILIEPQSITIFEGQKFENFKKHGTGCVLSSAITAYLSLNYNLKDSCKMAKNYIHNFIKSNNSNLGYHSINK